MQKRDIDQRLEGLLEELASKEHERWAHWQRHVHDRCERLADGSLVIPSDLVSRWEKQIATPYHRLSDSEKESDREQVRQYLPLIAAAFGTAGADFDLRDDDLSAATTSTRGVTEADEPGTRRR